ncbi:MULTISPECIES: CHAD domain-containing protein [Pseudomonas]|uniref:CHAD domain-containing protein n=1 Tax=Pseudomonas helleri TaxID=1608996 RepID=A0A6L5HTS8_9PSED|nr:MULTISPECIES: CHAD domain-containing protein [Pseudomonas]MQT47903.1 CHAD domain-containing protein [Pseudomonas helleri]MQT60266.1 CHAD domain-containing protein [Pseudomonas sp. FSL R10-0399]MQT88728.1 CHAD domain-containing protein [Pseudomonas helleri]MQU06458.1 CHAD domain-containing protein [Pseudomonas helleri]
MAFIDTYVKEILKLEVALFHARSRLEAETDGEALHDLRIAVRRIRSLLTPLRSVREMNALREAAAEVGRLTTPARDLEVMACELEHRGLLEAAATRRSRLTTDHRKIVSEPALDRLFAVLDQWPSAFRASEPGTDSRIMKQVIIKALIKQIDKLHAAVNDDQFDRHELRILVKRARYLTEAFPELSPLSRKAAKSLKAVQSALGSWHDHFQWCLKIKLEPDLQPLEHLWAEASVGKLKQAEEEMQKLKQFLPELTGKKMATL